MGTLTRTQAVTHARLLAGDTATTNPGRTDADYIEYIQEAYDFVNAFYGPRYKTSSQNNDQQLELTTLGSYEMLSDGDGTVEYEETVSCFYEGSSAEETYASPLEQLTYDELLFLRSIDTTPSDTPRYYCMHRDYNSGAITASAGVTWMLLIHPPVTAGTHRFAVLYRDRAATLTSSALMDATRPEEYLVCRLAALEAMRTIGERNPARWNVVASLIPEEMRANRGIKLYAEVGVSSMDVE